jgi:hypothetical protein
MTLTTLELMIFSDLMVVEFYNRLYPISKVLTEYCRLEVVVAHESPDATRASLAVALRYDA